MTTVQNNRLRMLLAIQAVLQEQHNTWENHGAFAEAVGELSAAILEVEQAKQQQMAKDGATNTKEVAMDLLGEVAYEVAGAAFAFASRTGNTVLAGRVDYAPAEITSGSQADVHARCKEIHAAATEVAPALVRYGITSDKLELLREQIEAFHEAQTRPRSEQGQDVAATTDLVTALTRANRELKEQLDRMVVQFKKANPQFLVKYEVARRVVHLTGSGPTAKGSAPSETSDSKAPQTPASPSTPVNPGGPDMPKAA